MAIQPESQASPSEGAITYLGAAHDSLDRIDLGQICQAASMVSESIGAGGIVHVFGTGHSSLLAQEVFFRAGGLVAVNPILDPRLSFERGALESTEFERSIEAAGELAQKAGFRKPDVGIVISNSGRNGLPVEMALQMKAAGLKVIGLTSLKQSREAPSRHPSGKRLFEVVDCVVDNHCPQGDAAVSVPGIRPAMGPLSTIVGAAILHATFLQAAERLAAQGKPPATFASANVAEDSLRILRELVARYQDRIPYYRPTGEH